MGFFDDGYFSEEIDGSHTSFYLLVSFFASGLIDGAAFNAWNCFVGMQTGKFYLSCPLVPSAESFDPLIFQEIPYLLPSASRVNRSALIQMPISNPSRQSPHSAWARFSSAPFTGFLAGLPQTRFRLVVA
jgi:hypothetical protein